MALTSTSFVGGGVQAARGARRAAAAAACAAILLALPAAAAGAAEPPGSAALNDAGMHAVGRTVLAAIGSTRAADAVSAIGDSLALLGARYRIESRAAHETPPPETPTEPVADPSTLPPASAGSNGTHVPRLASKRDEALFAHSRAVAGGESSAILLSGIALAPPDAPEAVKGVIDNANAIVGRPYIWGGGHGSWYSQGYDCSGSVSFALFGGGLIPRPLTSGDLEGWGAPGPGKWITVYANAGHTFAEIAGLRWDTVGDEKGTGPRWHLAPTSTAGFVVRHPPGL
jgi:cell wall-associated NlpC family hydrolase